MMFFNIVDVEVDKTWLAEKVYAPLKLYYLERGYDLEIVDPHWAIKDLTFDDHSEVEFCIKLIEECQQTSGPINFVVSYLMKRICFALNIGYLFYRQKHFHM